MFNEFLGQVWYHKLKVTQSETARGVITTNDVTRAAVR